MGDPVTMALMAVKVGGGIMEARNAKKSANMQAQSYERQALATQIETEQAAGNRARQYADAMSTESAGDNQAKELNQSASNARTQGNMAMMSGYMQTAGGALGDYQTYTQTGTPKGVKTNPKKPTGKAGKTSWKNTGYGGV